MLPVSLSDYGEHLLVGLFPTLSERIADSEEELMPFVVHLYHVCNIVISRVCFVIIVHEGHELSTGSAVLISSRKVQFVDVL